MAKEARDESKVEARLTEIQRQIADLQKQIKVIEYESDAYLNSRKKDAVSTLLRLPYDAEAPLAWIYGGAYRAASGQMSKRCSVWTTNVDDFLSRAPDAEIVNLASLFTKPTIVAILRQLVEGKKSIEDLAKGCGISVDKIEKAVETLIDAELAAHTEDNLIEPINDAVFYFLNFVGMTRRHLDPKDH